MDQRINPVRYCVSEEFIEEINVFIKFACSQAILPRNQYYLLTMYAV